VYIFKNKLDPERSKICENCGSKNTKTVCLDCEYFSGALPHQLFNMGELPEKTYDQEFKWKTRKFVEDYKNYITSIYED